MAIAQKVHGILILQDEAGDIGICGRRTWTHTQILGAGFSSCLGPVYSLGRMVRLRSCIGASSLLPPPLSQGKLQATT